MSDVVWTGFISIAVLTLYLGWFEKDPQRAILNYISSIVFWMATMIQWMVDNPNDFTLTWIYLLPITICLFQLYHEATEYLAEGFKIKKDPWAQ